MHIIFRIFVLCGVLLVGMIIAGGSRMAAEAVSHVGRILFISPVVTIVAFIALFAGLWMGKDHAFRRLAEHDRQKHHKQVDEVGSDWNPFI